MRKNQEKLDNRANEVNIGCVNKDQTTEQMKNPLSE